MARELGSHCAMAYMPAGEPASLRWQAETGIRDIAALGCDRATNLHSGPVTARPEADPHHATEA
jgi:hypothetical protein